MTTPLALTARALAALATLAAPSVEQGPAQDGPSYSREVRPILSEACFACHGPDEAARKADLRLDVAGADLGRALIERITSSDPDHVMPPPATGKSLTARQQQTLQAWVEAGAPYEKHWSFVRPQRPELPGDAAGGDHPVDRFVRAQAAARGLKLAPEADRLTLARRLYLDLTGLPPTPAQADEFAADGAPDAYEQLVDRLLASPQYAERQARR